MAAQQLQLPAVQVSNLRQEPVQDREDRCAKLLPQEPRPAVGSIFGGDEEFLEIVISGEDGATCLENRQHERGDSSRFLVQQSRSNHSSESLASPSTGKLATVQSWEMKSSTWERRMINSASNLSEDPSRWTLLQTAAFTCQFRRFCGRTGKLVRLRAMKGRAAEAGDPSSPSDMAEGQEMQFFPIETN
ncbi:hypothetical protein SASPL_135280 [Salvia splendens]|uniref:Uncharacterized protein n=1 Tax=Salvia splendens TaxID=180675 RepID=A0A8X8ZFT8_SALSN|nr:hypothetical protein SASPL_135280 [Salvia splendens]